ncbi:MAG: PAS domain S-box protein [Actinomycetota bacterium]
MAKARNAPDPPKNSERQFERLVRCIPDGLYTLRFNAAGEMAFTYVSARLCQILGINGHDLLTDSGLAFASVHPDDLAGLVQANERARQALTPFFWEGRFLVRGELRWIRISSEPTPLPGGGSEWSGIVSDTTDYKKALVAHHEQKTRMQAIFNGATDGIILADVNTRRFVDVNDTICSMLGYSREEMLQLGVDDIHPKAEMPRVIEGFLRQARGEVKVVEQPVQRNDGSVFSADVSVVPVEIDGQPYMAGFFRDITERKAAHTALQSSEKRLKTVLDTASDGIHVLDENGHVILCSESFARMLGYTPDEAANLDFTDWDAAHSREELHAKFQALFDNGATFETLHRRKDGSIFSAEINANGIEIDGRKYLYASSRDITSRKLAENLLKEKTDRLDEAQRIAKIGSWELDVLTNHLTWSNGIFRITELDETNGANLTAFLAVIHPDDRETVTVAWARSLQAREPYSIVYRLRTADGRIKHVHERGETDFDAKGWPLRSRGTLQDITEQSAAQERIRLYAKLFEHLGDAIIVTDHDNRIIEVNLAFTKLTGYSPEDVRGHDPKLLASGNTPCETYQVMWASLAEMDYWQGELWDRRKDGSVYPKWTSISAVRDNAGAVTHYVASFSDISERKAAEERMERLARYDPLTGLFNRFALQERMEQALVSAQRDGTQVAVMLIDMDRFKLINDTLGHQAGDALLVQVARRLSEGIRESDIVARLGGDEFVVVLTRIRSGLKVGVHIATKILEDLNAPYDFEGYEMRSTPSIGISVFPMDGENPAELLKNADLAMYHAKSNGKNNYQFFSTAMNEATVERVRVELDLRKALVDKQFEVHYQPQLCTADSRICSFEALVRWRHPERGLLSPAGFIPIAEETGLIEDLGAWVLDEACRQLAAWRKDSFGGLRVAVNLSAHQLRSPGLVDLVRQTMDRHGIGPGELELEVTESVAMNNPEQAIDQLRALRDLGISLAIDDFGTGYSSLAYLKLLPVHLLKLDRSFVHDIETDSDDAAISAATLALAHNLGLKVVAEGVETEGQIRFLLDHRCDFLQGYLLGRPTPGDQCSLLLGSQDKLRSLLDL